MRQYYRSTMLRFIYMYGNFFTLLLKLSILLIPERDNIPDLPMQSTPFTSFTQVYYPNSSFHSSISNQMIVLSSILNDGGRDIHELIQILLLFQFDGAIYLFLIVSHLNICTFDVRWLELENWICCFTYNNILRKDHIRAR
jgi:hypothetical protein